jgi:hypothetical protein
MGVDCLNVIQSRASAMRCMWVLCPTHVLFWRRIGGPGRAGFWLTVAWAYIGPEPHMGALLRAMSLYTEVFAGRMTLAEADALIAEDHAVLRADGVDPRANAG